MEGQQIGILPFTHPWVAKGSPLGDFAVCGAAAQVRQFAIEQAAGPFNKTLSEGLAKGMADKANSLWGSNSLAKENAVDRARTEVYQKLTAELDNGVAQERLATLISEDQRTAIVEAIADELADRLEAQMRARIRTQPSDPKPFTG